jgi:protein-ribulosamine 3-kinase
MRPPAEALESAAGVVGVVRTLRPVGGGCVSQAAEVVGGRERAFLKWSADVPPGVFTAEADGLAALRAAARGLVVPEVLGCAASDAATGWILLEWLPSGVPGPTHWRELGAGLAALHRTRSGGWGWERDGYIGSLPQVNAPAGGWAAFWAERRLEPQLRRATDAGERPGSGTEWNRLFSRLPELLAPADAEGPSLLHGDLWSGNVMAVADGRPALVDPATYRGHREVDLAMAELFGGFRREFRDAYEVAAPLAPGSERRLRVYQLYYLLVHVNLFGAGYRGRTVATLRASLAD